MESVDTSSSRRIGRSFRSDSTRPTENPAAAIFAPSTAAVTRPAMTRTEASDVPTTVVRYFATLPCGTRVTPRSETRGTNPVTSTYGNVGDAGTRPLWM